MPYFISHSSDKSLLTPELTRRHLQEATKPFQTPFTRNHIKLENFDNATTHYFNLLQPNQKFTQCCNFIYTTSKLLSTRYYKPLNKL